MNLSPQFKLLLKAYRAELAGLRIDASGNDVFTARLQQQRSVFRALLDMIACAPEKPAAAFFGGVTITNPEHLSMLSWAEPDEFLTWAELRHCVHLDPWAESLSQLALQDPNGERFMVLVACLEHARTGGHIRLVARQYARLRRNDEDAFPADVERDTGDQDAEQSESDAGEDWLAAQGFDRRG